MSTVIAKEGGHWYDRKGNPAYTYLNKKGEEKPTTLRQARMLNFYPSVTTIMKVKAQPGLEIWKQNQILQAAATLPAIEGESTDDWCKRVIADAGEHGKAARDKGTAIHRSIERFFIGLPVTEYGKEVDKIVTLLSELNIAHIEAEKSFSHSSGYGGKIDFVGEDIAGNPVVIDFKTTDFKDKGKKHWPEMVIQLAAYAQGIGKTDARLINVFISRNLADPEVDYYEWPADEISKGHIQFKLLLALWQCEKGYVPE
ncbi:MAG: hypothetical protein P1P89_22235 [Desulfobacterales bacterium]|nr:hypothetical protein [Desulfobacterales bacterium]